jgi:hypothetical protein
MGAGYRDIHRFALSGLFPNWEFRNSLLTTALAYGILLGER